MSKLSRCRCVDGEEKHGINETIFIFQIKTVKLFKCFEDNFRFGINRYVGIVKKNVLPTLGLTKIQTLWIFFIPEHETWPIESSFSAQLLPMTNLLGCRPIDVKCFQTVNSFTVSVNIKIGMHRFPNDNAKWAKLEAIVI